MQNLIELLFIKLYNSSSIKRTDVAVKWANEIVQLVEIKLIALL